MKEEATMVTQIGGEMYSPPRFWPRLLGAARSELEAIRQGRGAVRAGLGIEAGLSPVEIDVRAEELRRTADLALIGYTINPLDPNGR
jgi:hypothetical protein